MDVQSSGVATPEPSTLTQALSFIEELKVRVGSLEQQLANALAALQSVSALTPGPTQPPSGSFDTEFLSTTPTRTLEPPSPSSTEPRDTPASVVPRTTERKTSSSSSPRGSRSPPSPSERRTKRRRNSGNFFDLEASSDEEEDSTSPGKRPPPLVIGDKGIWDKFRQSLAGEGINIRRATLTADGVRVYLETTDDFRFVTRKLDEAGVPYTTFQLPEDRQLSVVIRGVHEGLSEETVLRELRNKVPATLRVHRMRGEANKIWPLVTVYLDRKAPSARSIFDVKTVGGIDVKVESRRKSNRPPQCRRCQRHGHSANYCRSPWVCAFCGRSHLSSECEKKSKKDFSPHCSNCGGAHAANDRSCPKAPKPRAAPARSAPPSPPASRQPLSGGSSFPPLPARRSYAQSLSQPPARGRPSPPDPTSQEATIRRIVAEVTADYSEVIVRRVLSSLSRVDHGSTPP